MDDAGVAHAGAKALIAQLRVMEQGDDHPGAKLAVLGAPDVRVGLSGFTTSMQSYARMFPVVVLRA